MPKKFIKESKFSNLTGILPLSSIIFIILLILLFYFFITGKIYNFYASFLFLFYGLTKRMWISVILLGVFQTLLLIPLRIVRLLNSTNIKEFQKRVTAQTEGFVVKQNKLHKDLVMGNKIFLFYVLDFAIQLTTFLSIGRLFLTDFYSFYFDPQRLYSFVPYPVYPIQDRIFQLPYLQVTKSLDLGWFWVIIAWLVIVLLQIILFFARKIYRKVNHQQFKLHPDFIKYTKYASGYMILAMIVAYFLMRHFPIGLALKIFKGDVGVPNRTLNTVTAVMTFVTILWHNLGRILRKSKLAREQQVLEKIINKTQQQMLKQAIIDAILVGLGAFFITNMIPSAFELSIFTLEIISLFAPFTLDKMILKLKNKVNFTPAESE